MPSSGMATVCEPSPVGTIALENPFIIAGIKIAFRGLRALFLRRMQLPLLDYPLNIQVREGRPDVWDPIRKSWVALTPEEHVRQRLICHFTQALHYPTGLIAVEKALLIHGKRLRFDLVVYERNTHQPWLLAECKAPEVTITDTTLQQLLRYHSQLQCSYWMMSNGHQHFCADARDPSAIQWMNELPAYDL